MNDKNCVILSGGVMKDHLFHQAILAQADLLICVDAGARHAKSLGFLPHIVVGDFDTLSKEELVELESAGVKIVSFAKEKDYSDTHMALLLACELGYTRINILAALGGRFDHALANVMLLALPELNERDVRIIDEKQEIFLIRAKKTLEGEIGDTLSLLPLSDEVTGIKTQGLYYEVPRGTFIMGIPNGISNLFSAKQVEIEIGNGLLLGIRVRGECNECP